MKTDVREIKAVLDGNIDRLPFAFGFALSPEGADYWSSVLSSRKLSREVRAKLLALLKLAAPPRGFAAMAPERQRAIASAGGKAVKPESRSFSQDRALAQAAGRKGGLAVPREKRTYSTNPELAVEAGRKGGKSGRRLKGLKQSADL